MRKFVKRCLTCGPLTIEQIYKNRKCIKCTKKKSMEYYHANKTICYEKAKVWKKENPEKVKVHRAKYNTLHHDIKLIKDRKSGKKYYQAHIIERRKKNLQQRLEATKNLDDVYVKSKLSRQFKLPASQIPDALVALKRPLLKLKRMIKEKNE